MDRPERLRGRLIAAIPSPTDEWPGGHLRADHDLVSRLADVPIGGVAVGTMPGGTGRRLWESSARELGAWREGLRAGQLLVASAGASPGLRRPLDLFEAALATARKLADLGVDLLVVQPPGAVRGRPDRDRLVLEYHSEVAEAGLPMLVSYRPEASGGIRYGPEVLAQLLARPEILGVEVATIDGIVTFQQVEALVRELSPSKLVVSGEERFLGYSLMCGADSALVGMGCLFPELVLELMEAHFMGDAARFLARNATVDALARAIFAPPPEGIAPRMLLTLVQRGVLPLGAIDDASGPQSGRAQLDRLVEALGKVDPDGRWSRGRRSDGSP